MDTDLDVDDGWLAARTAASARAIDALYAPAPTSGRRRAWADSAAAAADDDTMPSAKRAFAAKSYVSPYSFDRFERPASSLPSSLNGHERPELVAQLVAITYDERPKDGELDALGDAAQAHRTWYDAPVVRLAAVTADGQSVGVNCYGMTPYCYLASNSRLARVDVREIRTQLQTHLYNFTTHNELRAVRVVRVEHVQLTDMDGYQPDGASTLLRVHMAAPSHIVTLRNWVFSHMPNGVLEKNFDDASKSRVLHTPGLLELCDLQIAPRVWESNASGGGGRRRCCNHPNHQITQIIQTIQITQITQITRQIKFATRFQIDHELLELAWFRLPADSYERATGAFRCSTSVACDHSVLQSLGTAGEHARYAPMRYMSCDIETDYRVGQPKDQVSRVIQISCLLFNNNAKPPLVAREGDPLTVKPQVNLLFHLRRTHQPDNVDVMYAYGEQNTASSPNCQAELDVAEREMLLDFARLVRTYDHDQWFWYVIGVHQHVPRCLRLKI